MKTQTSTKENINKIIDFRQGLFARGFTKSRDAQFELLDALLLSANIRSFPELSLNPVFRRRWPSAYVALEDGLQDTHWLERQLHAQVPVEGMQVFALDASDWPHPKSRVLADCQFVHGASSAVDGGNIVIGHAYSNLAWVTAPRTVECTPRPVCP